ncbi:MAG: response regulator [Deltaproteobacteria bacterium]|nr:response regulator [Deltaproteobacteria bacterium]
MALRVMIVDDALFMRNMLKDIFVRAGYDVVAEAENGEMALELYQEIKPDLVTMDIVMPKKSGIEALQEIMAADPEACVVMVSALGQDSLVLDAVESGIQRKQCSRNCQTDHRIISQEPYGHVPVPGAFFKRNPGTY